MLSLNSLQKNVLTEKKKGKFFKEFLQEKRGVGAIAPSSKFLAKRMIAPIDFEKARILIELGPGTGKITKKILKEMGSDAKLIAFEINDSFIERLEDIADQRLQVINDSAANTGNYLKEGEKADCIVSSLPLAVIEVDIKDKIVSQAMSHLHADGQFIQFQYSLNDRKLLKGNFSEVKVDFTAINLPPAFVYKCKI